MSDLAGRVAAAVARHSRPRYLRIVAEILVHDRRAVVDGTRCECCRSPDAELVERRPAADLVLDTRTGRRISEAEETPARWAKYIALAQRHDIPLRCSTRTLPLLLDESDRHVFASGGNRAAKTTTGLYWLALQWLRRGGRERRFWLVASTDAKAFRLLEKLFKGTGESPAVLPRALVRRAPDTHRASNLQTTLIDGSLIDLRSFHGDPGAERMKSDAIVAALVDEAAHLPAPDSLAALRGRCLDAGGRLWLASTPRPSSFLKTSVVDPAQEFERLPAEDDRKRTGTHEGAAWIFRALPLVENPWVPLVHIERDMRTLDMTKAENRRDYAGEWAASEGLCWPDFEERHQVQHEARDIALLSPAFLARVGAPGHVPITADVVRGLFGRTTNPHYRVARASNFKYILGQDVNLNPMQTVVLQVTAPADRRADREQWHVWCVDGVTSKHSNSLLHAERLVDREMTSLWGAGGLVGCGVICDATSLGKVDPHSNRHGQSGSLAETMGRHGFDVRAAKYHARPGQVGPGHHNGERVSYFRLLHRLLEEGRLHVFSRSGALLNAFATQLVEPDGCCPIDSRRGHWDIVMGPMDALRYAVLAIMNAPAATPPQVGVFR